MKEVISGGLGRQWLEGKLNSIGILKAGSMMKRGIKGAGELSCSEPITISPVTAGICVGAVMAVYTSLSSSLLFSRGSLRLGSRLYRGQALPARVLNIYYYLGLGQEDGVKILDKVRGFYLYA